VLKRRLVPKTPSSSRRRFRVGRSKTGLGLFALKPIKRGDFIAYYSGRLITNKEADELWTKYLFEVNNRWTVDGSSRRNIARYINHACRPNAETDVKKHKIIITATKTIQPGEEITYNYGRDYFNAFIKPHGCRCVACKQKAAVKRSEARAAKHRKEKRAKSRAKKR
jgi:SET domain-containing protein